MPLSRRMLVSTVSVSYPVCQLCVYAVTLNVNLYDFRFNPWVMTGHSYMVDLIELLNLLQAYELNLVAPF